MQVSDPRRPLHFRPDEDDVHGTEFLPALGDAADLLFRVRGTSFRCDATVKRVCGRGGGVYLEPAIIEWSVRGFRVGGLSYSTVPSEALLRHSDGRTSHLPLINIYDDELHMLGWPVPRGLAGGTTYHAMLLIGEERIRGLHVELAGAQAIFTGGHGRILRASVTAGQATLARLVMSLAQEPERRAVVG